MKNAIATLKTKGYRITPARTALLETLHCSNQPLTIPELVARTASNEVSVYRNIDLFLKEQLIETITTPDSLPRYALSHGHHHHIVCNSCNKVAHIDCDHSMSTTPTHKDFGHILSHEVTYYGICTTCAP